MSEHSNLFNLKFEQMSARQFEKIAGYELWHRRLAYASNRSILDTIKCAIELEALKRMAFETHVKYPSCIIVKATLEEFPKAKRPINKPLYQKYIWMLFHHQSSQLRAASMNSYYLMPRLDTDGCMPLLLYGMKTKVDALKDVI